jgi:predicted histidine transporter YuiF (NhaC family)
MLAGAQADPRLAPATAAGLHLWVAEIESAVFPVVGMVIGLFLHWFGYRHPAEMTQRNQANIERRALTHSAA